MTKYEMNEALRHLYDDISMEDQRDLKMDITLDNLNDLHTQILNTKYQFHVEKLIKDGKASFIKPFNEWVEREGITELKYRLIRARPVVRSMIYNDGYFADAVEASIKNYDMENKVPKLALYKLIPTDYEPAEVFTPVYFNGHFVALNHKYGKYHPASIQLIKCRGDSKIEPIVDKDPLDMTRISVSEEEIKTFEVYMDKEKQDKFDNYCIDFQLFGYKDQIIVPIYKFGTVLPWSLWDFIAKYLIKDYFIQFISSLRVPVAVCTLIDNIENRVLVQD